MYFLVNQGWWTYYAYFNFFTVTVLQKFSCTRIGYIFTLHTLDKVRKSKDAGQQKIGLHRTGKHRTGQQWQESTGQESIGRERNDRTAMTGKQRTGKHRTGKQ